jgi:hypothetical protein
MLMYLHDNDVKFYPIMERDIDFRKTRDNRDMSNNALISFYYLKLICDFKSNLEYDCNSEEK